MEDEAIIQLFWNRSEEAVVRTEEKYGKLLMRITKNILRDSRDAEEAVWDTYSHLWNSIPPEKPRKLLAYAARLSRNAALDILRKKQSQKRDNRGDVLFSELEDCLPTTGHLSEKLEEQELVLLINTYLLSLDKLSRILFVRRYFAMDELDELASDFGMTKNAVNVRLYRVRQGLREHLQKEGVAV